ncbi:right-handed parallel beta-helix repeat-containing protein [Paenibacillus humicola]|uniref:right-handed parallel beta-helix repeat-containing protein n=1 Tax=Paenibacillus humicola TaxID=3110540 RepID=UPI00237A1D28|nr:right-handed parallel beta-helix repeat-containing protein [Paenibacillus humicola]
MHNEDRVREPAVIRLTDYGARPDSGEDAAPAMRRALEAAARTGGPVVLACAEGRYDFYPGQAAKAPYYISNTASEAENPDVTKTIGIYMKGLRDVTLDGGGALFIFHGKQTMFVIDECESVRIHNLHADYERPTVTEMTVERTGGRFMDVRVHPDSSYEIEDGRLFWIGDGWRFRDGPMQEYDPVTRTTWRIDNVAAEAERVEEIGPGRLRFHLASAPEQAPGRVLQMRDGIRDQVGVFITRSRNVGWTDAGMHFMHGLGIVCQYSEHLAFERMELAPRPETGRTVAAFADFLHVSGCRGRLRVTESRFFGSHDDAINVHGTHLRIVDVPSPNRIRVRFMHSQTYGFDAFDPGDEIEFVRCESLTPYGTGVVASAKRLNPREQLLTLESAVPVGIVPGDAVENVTWTPEVEIAGNEFAGVPTRGILTTTRRKVVIEGNRFVRLPMSAVLIADDAGSWFESGRTEEVRIRDNAFIECGDGGHPVILIRPENRDVRADNPVHGEVRIENNRFEMCDTTILEAKSTRALTFSGNRISMPDTGKSSVIRHDAIRLTACGEASIAGNAFHGDGLNKTLRLFHMPPDAVSNGTEL